jgi:hypothetical protein
LLLYCVRVGIAFVCAAALAVTISACSNRAQLFESNNDGGWFSKPVDFFAKPAGARTSSAVADFGPTGTVAPEDLVNADASCAPKAVEASQATATPAVPAASTAAGNIGGAAAASTAPNAASAAVSAEGTPALGGIALGMSECDAVRRAGAPSNVAISAGEQGERKVVLTYLAGSWPGIYTFSTGRLQIVDAVPESEKPKKPPAKKKKALKHAQSAAR